MKTVLTIFLFVCFSTFGYSQSKIEFGIATEGSWFMPQKTTKYSEQNRAGYGIGIGAYASRNIFWRFSADIGLMYRYKKMEKHYKIYPTGDGDGGYEYGGYGNPSLETKDGWDKYTLHYVVVPIHLQLLLSKSFFIRGGIESSLLTKFGSGRKKTENNWTVGFGSQKHKLKWMVNYIRGFKDVGFINGKYEMGNGKYLSGPLYRNNMLQLSLFYPLWQLK